MSAAVPNCSRCLDVMDSYGDVCVVLKPGNVRARQAGSVRAINPETSN